ncbi:MAG: electron transport complex subunit RsxC [Ruminococcaceae bacterium]|nr:electron transport complex subunit RsxC [Oscillospiraceae bacterium]
MFKLGKTKIPHRKNTAAMEAVRMPAPATVTIPVAQNIGAPSVPCVKVMDKVYVGTKIADAGGYVGAPIHSSVSGTVKKIDSFLLSNGRSCNAIIIESDGEMTPDPAIKAPVVTNLDELCDAVRESGLVGLGGAGFPAAVKLDAAKKGIIKKVVINAAECEPYITADTRTMLDNSDYVVKGIQLLLDYVNPDEIVIGVEKNKPEAIKKLSELLSDKGKVRIVSLPETYPQGAEKILIYNATGLVVPEGGLPSDVGCLVMNVTSLAFLAKYVETGMPLVEKCLTVDGSAIESPKNVIAPIGTSIRDIIEFTGSSTENIGKVLYGGPMMGVAVYNLDDPILKNTNALTAFNKNDSIIPKSYPCIHCGRCVSACPMGLNPTAYAKAMKVEDKNERADRLVAAKINLCMECGCCSFVCPSRRPLVETNRLAKADLRNTQAANKN